MFLFFCLPHTPSTQILDHYILAPPETFTLALPLTANTNPIHNDVLQDTTFLLLNQISGEANKWVH